MEQKKSKYLCNLDLMIMCVLICVIFLTLLLQVIMRWIVGRPLTWSEEIARYSYVWITMLALEYNQRTGNNISMSLVTEKLPRLIRLILAVVTDILVIISCCLPLPAIFDYFTLQVKMKSNTLGYSLGLVAASIPIGFILLIVMLIIHCIRLVVQYKNGKGEFSV